MNILFITEFYPKSYDLDTHGGIETRTFYITQGLAKKHTISVIAALERGKPDVQKVGNVQIYRVGLSRTYSRLGNIFPRVTFLVAAIIKGFRLKFDLVEGTGFFSWLPAYILGGIKSKKRVMFVADLISEYAYGLSSFQLHILKSFERIILHQKWDAVLCISQTVKKKLTSNTSKALPIYVIYCGTFLKHATYKKNKSWKICAIARLVPYKRIQDILIAISILKLKKIFVSCEIIGDGESKDILIALARSLGIEDKITFHGYIHKYSGVMNVLRRCNILCLPSVVEGFGIVTIEALSYGIPVVLADISVNHEITHNRGVIFHKSADPSSLANSLLELIGNKVLYRKLQKQGHKISQEYDWKKIIFQTEKMYENLCTY